MKKNVQPILLLTLLLGLVLLLAACMEQTAEAPVPTSAPTAEPTAEPTSAPTAVPTETPTAIPTETPTAEPTAEPVKEVEIVKETPKPTPTPEPTPTPAPTPTPVPTPFSIVWMSDTQNLSRRFPEVFNSMRDWILWVAGVMEQYPDAIVLFVVHSGLQEDGRLSAQGQDVFDSSVTINPNARLLLCGHQHGTLLRTDWLDDDGDGEAERSFTSMMFNYQDDYEDGLGYLRILTFYPEDRRIEVKTYSPWLDRWGYVNTPPEEDAFTLENAY